MHVSKKASSITGICILLFYIVISTTMILLGVDALLVIFSVLAFFSLTTSYVVPIAFKLKRARSDPDRPVRSLAFVAGRSI